VFADWLEERGDARGEFIRRQCELEQLDEDDPARAEHESRCQLLLAMHKSSWLGDLPKMVRDYRFRRGFVHWVQLSAKNFLAHGDELFDLAPIRQVTINDINSYLDDVAACPNLARLEGLDIKPEFSWRQTDYPASLLTDEGLRILLGSPHLAHLQALDLGYNHLTDTGFVFISRGSLSLRRLDVSHNHLEGPSLSGLGTSLDSLTELAINNNPFAWPTMDFVLPATPAPLLRHSFPHVEVLRLESTNLTDRALATILMRKTFPEVRQLFLDGNSLDAMTLDELLKSSRAPHLKVLSLNAVTTDGDRIGEVIGRCPDLGSLRRLSFRHNHMEMKGAESVAASSLTSLRLLDLRDNAIGDAGCAAIASSATLANLTTLLLAENSIGDAGALALAKSPYLERIVEIRLGNNPIGSAARHALQSRFGHRVIFDS
jgi:hypothetical protein